LVKETIFSEDFSLVAIFGFFACKFLRFISFSALFCYLC